MFLSIKDLKKSFGEDEYKTEVLKGIDFEIEKGEIYVLLGPSGSGKSTLLNIIGGIDQPDSGTIMIQGKTISTLKEKDLTNYRRNHLGYVFQMYNLISHLNVEQNIDVGKYLSKNPLDKEELLQTLGLKEHRYKQPNQLSGGQMQRVAIARALVNDPDIILADEPTGALDTKTSVQIMELLKSISKDKLIIMVTHNPTLAEKYSTRVIRVLDGVVQDDTNPYSSAKEEKKKAKSGKTAMSFFTAISLSLNNLMTKKGRTILTSFAGSIGIIGIALILSLSTGVQNYINQVQEDTLSSYPIQIQETTVDLTSMMERMMGEMAEGEEPHEDGKIYSNNIMTDMLTVLADKKQTNNLEELKKYIDEGNKGISDNANAIIDGITYLKNNDL